MRLLDGFKVGASGTTTIIPTNGKPLILSEFAEIKVLLYRNRFGEIFDFIGIRGG